MSDTVYGVCAGCGAVAWELLSGQSDYCMGCDSPAYQPVDDDESECARCDCRSDADCIYSAVSR